ncbi:hypothetical protein DSC91_007623 (plasmid) [Paraburkholderia caffeinilytica]|uniref:Uncharacterized protein n=2 Tax=Paraburkholderia TaxID=1822464 RepID=A0A6J5FNA0_9BURK|nr:MULTISPECIES: hypothetical protein [Paraburkholderia]AXL53938.1 hypothetical protein DSC91_007623 [Paraburkholderia caffeinilytica]GGC65155.1 hypothetical protein GCM10011400_61410 [Paraburkholderia caffeinilytica]CAB3781894.1 hypothetical protein LMG28688_01371 [Paraburkholderia caffeinitolerans]CAB3802462.1 hypothetical protein LMG28690_05576 [Paraburkholderia caffeinilytica]
MNLKITYPDDFPLHGLDRDMFETKLRNALRFCFYGNTVRQLAERVDARRAREVPDALPLRQIADEHAFEDCMALDGCRIDDMSAPLRRNLLRNVGARIGLTISEWGDSALPSLDEPVNHAMDVHATNRQAVEIPAIYDHQTPRISRIWLVTGLCAVAVIGGAGWKLTRPAVPLSATVVSTSPAQTLRELASSVPDDRRPYRVSVQIELQDTGTTSR